MSPVGTVRKSGENGQRTLFSCRVRDSGRHNGIDIFAQIPALFLTIQMNLRLCLQ